MAALSSKRAQYEAVRGGRKYRSHERDHLTVHGFQSRGIKEQTGQTSSIRIDATAPRPSGEARKGRNSSNHTAIPPQHLPPPPPQLNPLTQPLPHSPHLHLSNSTPLPAMTRETTPPTAIPATNAAREPPSLPASPLPKRTKTNDADMTASNVPVTSIQQQLPPLLIKKLVDSAKAPTRGSAFAAGYDMYAAKETVVPAKGKALIDTGIAMAVPEGTCMF